jgi:hypothetical protein
LILKKSKSCNSTSKITLQTIFLGLGPIHSSNGPSCLRAPEWFSSCKRRPRSAQTSQARSVASSPTHDRQPRSVAPPPVRTEPRASCSTVTCFATRSPSAPLRATRCCEGGISDVVAPSPTHGRRPRSTPMLPSESCCSML